mmetsp:Transcript_8859/g.17168  ORF Transcript_8859/g.17168 Transcript_8859/m.17168 type:complete len:87 (+) Transcript_8859:14-274(+)
MRDKMKFASPSFSLRWLSLPSRRKASLSETACFRATLPASARPTGMASVSSNDNLTVKLEDVVTVKERRKKKQRNPYTLSADRLQV